MKQSSRNAHAITNRLAREKKNTSIAGNVTKYSILHTQESFDKKIITMSNFAHKNFGAMSQSDTCQYLVD